MQVGDLVKGTPSTSSKYGDTTIGIIVGEDPHSRGRVIVQWNDMPKSYPEPRHFLEVISESR